MLLENADRFRELAEREPEELTEREDRELERLAEEVRAEIRAVFYTL